MDFSMHGDGEHDRLEAGALAGGAGHLAHVALEALAAGVALGLLWRRLTNGMAPSNGVV